MDVIPGIEIHEKDGSLTKVEWKFELMKKRGRKTQALKLPVDGFHPNSPQFNISCSYSTDRNGTCNGCYEFKVNFSLNQAKSPHQDDVQNQDKPIAILAIVDYNDSEKFPLMELQCSDKLNAWKSEEEIQIDASCCRQPKTKDDSLIEGSASVCDLQDMDALQQFQPRRFEDSQISYKFVS